MMVSWQYLRDDLLYPVEGLVEVVDDVVILQGEQVSGLVKNK